MHTLILGSDGFLGKNLAPQLKLWLSENGQSDVVTASRRDCDLQCLSEVKSYFQHNRPHTIVHLAGRVGGFLANKSRPADIGLINLQIGVNILTAARCANISRIINFVGSCSYPSAITNGITEAELSNGRPDATSAAYAIGKSAIHENLMAMNYQDGMDNITLVPANVYGPYDHFDPDDGHVVPALIYKIHQAKVHGMSQLKMIGSGNAKRDFLFAPDLLTPIKHILSLSGKHNFPRLINIGTGRATSIKDLASIICDVVGYSGELCWENSSENDGQNIKFLDCRLLNSLKLDFKPTELREGISKTYGMFLGEP